MSKAQKNVVDHLNWNKCISPEVCATYPESNTAFYSADATDKIKNVLGVWGLRHQVIFYVSCYVFL